MQEILTSGQCGQSFAPDGRPLAPDGLLYEENHSLGEWFKRSLMAMM